jgi:hypothetical protein
MKNLKFVTNSESTLVLKDKAILSFDPEIISLCDELEELGGGINTRYEPIRTHIYDSALCT